MFIKRGGEKVEELLPVVYFCVLLPACMWCCPEPASIPGGACRWVWAVQDEVAGSVTENIVRNEKYSSSHKCLWQNPFGLKAAFLANILNLYGKETNRQFFGFVCLLDGEFEEKMRSLTKKVTVSKPDLFYLLFLVPEVSVILCICSSQWILFFFFFPI